MKLQLQFLFTITVCGVAIGATYTTNEIVYMIVDNLQMIGILFLSTALAGTLIHELLSRLLKTILITSTVYLLIFKIEIVLCLTVLKSCTFTWG